MSKAQTADKTAPFSFSIPIAKVDKEKRLVRGVATAEVLDAHGQIVDYEAAKPVFEAWVGNIREMHQPIAVGKRTSVEFDDEHKQIILESYVSKGAPETWEKVLDGTLSMYSIGGEGVIKTDKVAKKGRIFLTGLSETSLVDNGACPVAKFDIVKTVDGAVVDCQPDEPVEQTEQPDPKAALVVTLSKFVDDATTPQRARMAAASARTRVNESTAVVKAYPESYDITCALQAIALLEQLLSSEWWEAAQELATGDDEEKTDQAQLALLRNAVNLVIAFLTSEFEEQFADFDGAAEGASEDAAGVAMRKMKGASALVIQHLLKGLDLAGIVKAGARHSKADVEMIQKMHDTSVSLGAACGTSKRADIADPASDPAAEPVEKQTDPAPAAEPVTQAAPDVQTIVKAAVEEALKAHQATSLQTIAELTERIDKLANTPKPGGPMARAVPIEKQLAGGSTTTATGEPAIDNHEVLHAFDVVAKEAKTPEERANIAARKLAFMREHKLGTLNPVTGEPL